MSKPSVQDFSAVIMQDGFDRYQVRVIDTDNHIQYLFRFRNGFGASVAWINYKSAGTYGCGKALWELALIKWNSADEYDLVYDVGTFADVVGHLTAEEVVTDLERIKKLAPRYLAGWRIN